MKFLTCLHAETWDMVFKRGFTIELLAYVRSIWGVIIRITSYVAFIVPQKQIANINIKKKWRQKCFWNCKSKNKKKHGLSSNVKQNSQCLNDFYMRSGYLFNAFTSLISNLNQLARMIDFPSINNIRYPKHWTVKD